MNGCIEDVDIKEGHVEGKNQSGLGVQKTYELPLVKIKFFRTFTGVDVIDCKDKYFIIYFIVKLTEVLLIQTYNWFISKIKLSSRFSLPLLRIVNGKKSVSISALQLHIALTQSLNLWQHSCSFKWLTL